MGFRFALQLTLVHLVLSAPFDGGEIVGYLNDAEVNEASGLAASRIHPGILYTHNDSGGRNRVYAISANNAALVARLDIDGASNCDWEDIAVGPGPNGENYIYIGDIGANAGSVCQEVYRVREPDFMGDQTLYVESSVKYNWVEPDSESLMVDEAGQAYLITKTVSGDVVNLYQIPNDAWGSPERITLSNPSPVSISFSSNGPVAGDLNPGASEILVKTYGSIRYWVRNAGESVQQTLSRPGDLVDYQPEKQGESVCFSANNDGFYTLSEGVNAPLWYHRRIGVKRNATLYSKYVPYSHAQKSTPTLHLMLCSFVSLLAALM